MAQMTNVMVDALLWFAAIGCSLLGGLFFTFSAFVMRALGSLAPAAGIAAMNAINRDILRSLFMPLFWGTTLAALALAILALWHWEKAGAPAMFAAGMVYVLGMFMVTVAIEVPQNNRLQAVDANDAAALPVWQRYLSKWTAWNHVRTVACLLAGVLCVAALLARA
jgi:uncharacterized membrane protein